MYKFIQNLYYKIWISAKNGIFLSAMYAWEDVAEPSLVAV